MRCLNQRSILLAHGFGLNQQYWSELIAEFDPAVYNFIFHEKEDGALTADIAIGHSLGFLKLCQQLQYCNTLIGLNAFTNFLGNDEALQRKRQKEHKQFAKHFKHNHQLSLERFYLRSGFDVSKAIFKHSQISQADLLTDLKQLQQNVTLPNCKNIVIINAFDDVVVPPVVTMDNFYHLPVQCYLLPNGQHALGQQHVQKTAELIKRAIS